MSGLVCRDRMVGCSSFIIYCKRIHHISLTVYLYIIYLKEVLASVCSHHMKHTEISVNSFPILIIVIDLIFLTVCISTVSALKAALLRDLYISSVVSCCVSCVMCISRVSSIAILPFCHGPGTLNDADTTPHASRDATRTRPAIQYTTINDICYAKTRTISVLSMIFLSDETPQLCRL